MDPELEGRNITDQNKDKKNIFMILVNFCRLDPEGRND